MKVTTENTQVNTVKLTIEVDAQRFEEAMEQAYRKVVKQINMPGFRRGKAPRKVVENYYTEAVFYEEAMDIILPEAYDAAVQESGIFPVDRPQVDIVSIGNGQGVVFTAEVTVKPEVQLGEYKGLSVKKNSYPVTDEAVEAEVLAAAERIARWVDVTDRAVENGDRVTLDYSGSVNGVLFDGGTAENQTLEIGSGRFIPGFEEQLVGMNAGDEKDIDVTFPTEYHEATLAGKPAVFHVRIHDIKMREMPALDDELAKDISEFDTLDEYKDDIRKTLSERNAQREVDELQDALVNLAVENATIDIPECMINNQLDSMLQELQMQLMYQGLRLEDYMRITGSEMDAIRAESRPEALRRVRTSLVLEAIAKQENIEATEDDMQQELQRLADARRQELDAFTANLTDDDRSYLSANLATRKTVEFLQANATIEE